MTAPHTFPAQVFGDTRQPFIVRNDTSESVTALVSEVPRNLLPGDLEAYDFAIVGVSEYVVSTLRISRFLAIVTIPMAGIVAASANSHRGARWTNIIVRRDGGSSVTWNLAVGIDADSALRAVRAIEVGSGSLAADRGIHIDFLAFY